MAGRERIDVIFRHLHPSSDVSEDVDAYPSHRRLCRSDSQEEKASKIATAAEAVSGIPDGVVLAVRSQ